MAIRFKLDENLPRNTELLLRPRTQSIDSRLALLSGALGVLESEQAESRLWLVEPGQVRIRE